MTKIFTLIRNLCIRQRRVGDDTRRLPSLIKAMKELVPRSVMKEVLASSNDRRQWGVLAAAWVGVSEREFMNAAARELHMPFQDGVAVPDLTVFGERARLILQTLRRVGATVLLDSDKIVGFVVTDPAEIRGTELFDGTQTIAMASWTEISKSLDLSEKMIAEVEVNADRGEVLRRRELCERVLNVVVTEAFQHGATSVELLSTEGKGRYQFTTLTGQTAIGAIQPIALEQVLLHVNSLQGDVFSHPTAGRVLVRSLGSASTVRLSWKMGEDAKASPRAIEWMEQVEGNSPSREFLSVPGSGASVSAAGEIAISVLVVDDNPMFSRILQRMLKRERCEVSFAENGEEALQALMQLTSFLPRVIICDLHMPRMNGKEFVSRVRSDPRLSRIPIVMLTSDDGVDVEVTALEIGANAVVSKTKDPRVLCAQVMRLAKPGGLQEAA
jgi:CheY-like chemotaxis protein